MPNYVGKNNIEAKTTLEKVYKMKVTVEPKDVDITEKQDTSLIIEQSIKPGTEVEINEEHPTEITLYIPNAYDFYPNFVEEEGWTVEEIEKFAEKYNLNLIIKYVVSDEPEGKIIKQSRTGKIVEGINLTITIASKQESTDITNNTEPVEANTQE